MTRRPGPIAASTKQSLFGHVDSRARVLFGKREIGSPGGLDLRLKLNHREIRAEGPEDASTLLG
jgi:hypothetical protein